MQAQLANEMLEAMLLPPPKAKPKSVLPMRPPNKTETVKTTTEADATTATPRERRRTLRWISPAQPP